MKSMSRSERIKYGIVVILVLACFLIPTTEVFTMQAKMFMAVTVFGLAISAFELLPMTFVAMVMPALWAILGVADVKTIMSPWTSSTMLMLLGVYFMSATLDDSGLLKRVAYRLMCVAKSNYLALLTMVFLVSVFINLITSGTSHLVMAPLVAGLFKSLNGDDKKLGAGLGATVLLGGCTSHCYTYFSTMVPVVAAQCGEYLDPSAAAPLKTIIYNIPQFFISIVVLLAIYKMFKPEGSLGELSYFKEKLAELGPLSQKEKANGVMLAIVLVLVFTADLHKLDINLIFALIPWIVYLPFFRGADAGTLKKFNISMVLVCGTFMAIGNVATALGLGAALAAACQTILAGHTNIFLVMFLILVVVFVLNKLMTPMAITALFMKPVAMLATQLGYSATPFFYAMMIFPEFIIFPYEYVPYLVVFGYGMMSMKDFIKFNSVRCLIMLVGFFVLQIPFWMLVGLI